MSHYLSWNLWSAGSPHLFKNTNSRQPKSRWSRLRPWLGLVRAHPSKIKNWTNGLHEVHPKSSIILLIQLRSNHQKQRPASQIETFTVDKWNNTILFRAAESPQRKEETKRKQDQQGVSEWWWKHNLYCNTKNTWELPPRVRKFKSGKIIRQEKHILKVLLTSCHWVIQTPCEFQRPHSAELASQMWKQILHQTPQPKSPLLLPQPQFQILSPIYRFRPSDVRKRRSSCIL